MSGPDPLSLEQRVARLERLVARLLEQTDGPASASASTDSSSTGSTPRDSASTGAGPTGARRPWDWSDLRDTLGSKTARGSTADLADHGERWLGRVGVAFVILAFAFLFKYAFDQGWVGPSFRLTLGLLAATAMLGVGLRLEGSRERYSQYLLGGAVGLYYLVGYASYELYGLVPFAVAFAFMCAVTVLAFVLAERQRLPSLAVIGAAGGLSTPFVVSTGTGNVPALVAYTMLLLAGAGAIQFLRGWRGLLLVLGFGGLAVMGLAVGMAAGPSDVVEVAVTTVGVLAATALFGVVPLLRAHLRRVDPETWRDPPLSEVQSKIGGGPERLSLALLRVGCVTAGLVGVLLLAGLYSMERSSIGVLYGLACLIYLVLARGLMRTSSAFNATSETASLLLILAITLFFFDYRVMLPLAAAGSAMHLAHTRWRLPGVALLAHLLFAQLALLVVSRPELLGVGTGSPFDIRQLGALGAIVLALASSFVLETPSAKQVYRLGAHVAFMVWLATQFAPMERAQELISLSWGTYGIVLLLVSLQLRERGMQLAGLATLGIVAAKLLVVDLAQVDVIWRILLFMGFGGAFLGLSYLINRQAEGA